jgi:Holliday junction resolvasome RuvABC endonuclease subunit
MITAILQLSEIPASPDACDALAVALAALNRRSLPEMIRT